MTIVDDRPDTSTAPNPVSGSSKRSSSPVATWALAARLARREVRRRPGRTILVMMLVALPVLAMSAASIVSRTNAAGDDFTRQFGRADVVVERPLGGQLFDERGVPLPGDALDGDLLDGVELPTGTDVTRFTRTWSSLWAEIDGDVVAVDYSEISDVDLTDPIASDTIVLSTGRAPRGADDVLVSPDVAERFDVEVGDELRLVRPDLRLDVVGIGRDAAWSGSSIVVLGELDVDLLVPEQATEVALVDLPVAPTASEFQATVSTVSSQGRSAYDRSVWNGGEEGVTAQQLAWSWVALVVSLVAVGIVIAAAFATSARRQLVTIGQLSANGASERLVRRTMGFQGAWTGLFGAALGVGLGVVGAFALHGVGLFERFTSRPVDSPIVAPLDLVVIAATAVAAATIAALVPARSASRIPVLSALAGRRPVATPPKWLAPTGVALFVGGLFLLGGAAATNEPDDFTAMLAVIGSLGVLFGMVCASPLIVAGVAAVGARRGGVVRLASRSLGRSRARSAAVLTAIAVVGALATAGATGAGSAADRDDGWRPDLATVRLESNRMFDEAAYLPENGVVDLPADIPAERPDRLLDDLARVLPDAEIVAITSAVDDPLPYVESTGMPVVDADVADLASIYRATVATDQVVSLYDLSEDELDVLEREGILTLAPWYESGAYLSTPDGPLVVDLSASEELIGVELASDGTSIDGSDPFEEFSRRLDRLPSDTLITSAFVEANELDVATFSYRFDNPVDLTGAQRDAVRELGSGGAPDAFVAEANAPGYDDLGGAGASWYAYADSPTFEVPWALIQAGVAGASLVMVLLVVAIGLSLAATESRDERDVLHAVGAAPTTLRRVSATKAWVLTTGAAVVAVPAGYVTVFVVTRATEASAPFPFGLAVALLVVVPLVSAAATLTVSAIAQRVRPVMVSTMSGA